MFVFEFAGALFKFKAKAPAFEVLSQLPPRLKALDLVLPRQPR